MLWRQPQVRIYFEEKQDCKNQVGSRSIRVLKNGKRFSTSSWMPASLGLGEQLSSYSWTSRCLVNPHEKCLIAKRYSVTCDRIKKTVVFLLGTCSSLQFHGDRGSSVIRARCQVGESLFPLPFSLFLLSPMQHVHHFLEKQERSLGTRLEALVASSLVFIVTRVVVAIVLWGKTEGIKRGLSQGSRAIRLLFWHWMAAVWLNELADRGARMPQRVVSEKIWSGTWEMMIFLAIKVTSANWIPFRLRTPGYSRSSTCQLV